MITFAEIEIPIAASTTSTGTTSTVMQQKHLLCADGEKREG